MVDLGAFGGSIDPVRFEGSIEQGLVTFLLEDGDTVVVEVSADGAIQSAVFHSAEGAVLKHTTARAVSRANPEGVFGEDTKLLDV